MVHAQKLVHLVHSQSCFGHSLGSCFDRFQSKKLGLPAPTALASRLKDLGSVVRGLGDQLDAGVGTSGGSRGFSGGSRGVLAGFSGGSREGLAVASDSTKPGPGEAAEHPRGS